MSTVQKKQPGLVNPGQKPDRRVSRFVDFLLIVTVLLFLAVQVQRAWLSDDAFITFRTIDNFRHGFGLVWNIGERVQSYTHPLWMLILSAANLVTHDLVFTSMLLSIILSLAAILLLATRIAVTRLSALYVILVLILSNAFVDYSTSGLENPLSHLLLVIFFVIYFNEDKTIKKIFWLSLTASFGILNRLDLFLIFAPALLYNLFEVRQVKGIWALIAGQLPLILWEGFSILYYGFPFPNTAYAKLNTGIPALDMAIQGIAYFKESLHMDPITLAILISGVFLAFLSREKREFPIAVGVLLYIVYVVKIGGDFMSGRFLAAPLLCSLIVIARFDLSSLAPLQVGLLFSATLVLGLLSPTPTLNFQEADLTPKQRSAMVNDYKISNERRYYGWSTRLLRIDPTTRIPDHPYANEGLQARQDQVNVARRITVGMFGYYAGPKVYVVDELALGDALLARLPARRVDQWRIGHFQRVIPDGYLETLRSNENRLADSRLARFYDQLLLITRGDLLSTERLAAIWKINSGQLNDLIDWDTYRYPKLVRIGLDQVNRPQGASAAWDDPGNVIFNESGIEIDLGSVVSPTQIELSLDGDNAYQLIYIKAGQEIARQAISPASTSSGMKVFCIDTPRRARQHGFDSLRIFATAGDEQYSLGRLRLENCRAD